MEYNQSQKLEMLTYLRAAALKQAELWDNLRAIEHVVGHDLDGLEDFIIDYAMTASEPELEDIDKMLAGLDDAV